jgi:hypothetical protein
MPTHRTEVLRSHSQQIDHDTDSDISINEVRPPMNYASKGFNTDEFRISTPYTGLTGQGKDSIQPQTSNFGYNTVSSHTAAGPYT